LWAVTMKGLAGVLFGDIVHKILIFHHF